MGRVTTVQKDLRVARRTNELLMHLRKRDKVGK